MEMEVNPCPFCGGEAKLMGGKVYTIPEIDRNGAYVGADIEVEPSWVECQSCHAMGQVFDESDEDPENAVAAWNAAGGKARPVRHDGWMDAALSAAGSSLTAALMMDTQKNRGRRHRSARCAERKCRRCSHD